MSQTQTVGGINVRITADNDDLRRTVKDTQQRFDRLRGATDKLRAATTRVGAGFTKFRGAVDRVKRSAGRARKSLAALHPVISKLKWAWAALSAVMGIGHAITMHAIDSQSRMAEQFGGTYESLGVLNRAMENTGGSINDLTDSFEEFTDKLGEATYNTGTARDALNRLGLTSAELQALDLDGKLLAIADAMDAQNMTTEQAVFTLGELGFSQTKVMDILKDGGAEIRRARREIEQYGFAISNVDAKLVQEAQREVKTFIERIKDLFAQLFSSAAAHIQVVGKLLNDSFGGGDWREQFRKFWDWVVIVGVQLLDVVVRIVGAMKANWFALKGIVDLFALAIAGAKALGAALTAAIADSWVGRRILGLSAEEAQRSVAYADEMAAGWNSALTTLGEDADAVMDGIRMALEGTAISSKKLIADIHAARNQATAGVERDARDRGGGVAGVVQTDETKSQDELTAEQQAAAKGLELLATNNQRRLELIQDGRTRELALQQHAYQNELDVMYQTYKKGGLTMAQYQELQATLTAENRQKIADINGRYDEQEREAEEQKLRAAKERDERELANLKEYDARRRELEATLREWDLELMADQEEADLARLADRFDREQDMLDEAKKNMLLTEQQHADATIALEERRSRAVEATRKKHMTELQKFEQMSWADRTRTSITSLATQLNAIKTNSRTVFNLAKAANIAQAIMDTHASYNAALKGPPGPPWSYAIAAAAAVAGFSRVAAIKSQTFGGGGSTGGGATPSVSSAATASTAATRTPAAEDEPGRSLAIRISGLDRDSLFSGEQVSRLLESFNDQLRDGARLVVS